MDSKHGEAHLVVNIAAVHVFTAQEAIELIVSKLYLESRNGDYSGQLKALIFKNYFSSRHLLISSMLSVKQVAAGLA